MIQLITKIQESIQQRRVPISNIKLKSILENYSILYVSKIIDSENNKDIFEKMEESKLITICSHKKEEKLYFIISFERTIIIVLKESISFLKNLFLSHTNLTICFNNDTKPIFDSSIEIEYVETKLDFEDCYVEKYIKNSNIIYTKILSSILQYLIKNSYII